MQAPTSQEREHLDQMDIVIGLSDEEARCLLHIWRACDQTFTAHAPKQVTDEFRRAVRERRHELLPRMLQTSRAALDSRSPALMPVKHHYNGGVFVEAV